MNEQNLTPMNLDGVSSILLNVYQKMIEDGTIEKIARDQIAKMIESTLHDAMSWNGPAKEQFKARIEPLLIQAIERSDLNSMTEKLTGVINQALNASTAGSYKEICNGIKSICGAPRFKYNQVLKLSDIFKAYCKSCESAFSNIYFDKDNLEQDEDGKYTVLVSCSMNVEQEKRYWGDGDLTVTFEPSCEDLDSSEADAIIDNSFCVKIHDYQSLGDKGKKRLLWFGTLDALTLRKLPEFALYLQAAKDSACLIDIDSGDNVEDIEIEFDE